MAWRRARVATAGPCIVGRVASSVGRLVATLALVAALPTACIAAIALYGRALSESDVAIGTLVSPEVARARSLELQRRFLAMSPAEHLAEARAALATPPPTGRRLGGNPGLAQRHLDAIPPTAPEHAAAELLRAEIANRRLAFWRSIAERVGGQIRAQSVEPSADETRRRAAREALATALDRRPPEGLGGVHLDGDAGAALRLDRRRCDQPMLDAVFPASNVDGLRALGVRAVRCANDAGALAF